MPTYGFQAILLAGLLSLFCLRKRTLDLYIAALIAFWTVAVIFIYWRYGADQVNFYSNDQYWHWRILNQYLPWEGIRFNRVGLIGMRYLITLPAYFATKAGFDGILFIKFTQLIYLVLIYRLGRRFLARHSIQPKVWHLCLYCGPLMIFMSTLAMRDLAIGFFTASFILERNHLIRIGGLFGSLLLRPHLAVALVVGWAIAKILSKMRPKFYYWSLFLGVIIMYTAGAFMYFVGSMIQEGISFRTATNVFNQYKFTRFGANLMGLQFLTLSEFEVRASIVSLFLARAVFFDTFITPLAFLFVLLIPRPRLNELQIMVFMSFAFFYGLVSQTAWNSTRQNIPFLISMGLLAIVGITQSRRSRPKLGVA